MVARGELQKLEDELWAVPRPVQAGESQSGARQRPQEARADGPEATRSGRERLRSGRLELHRDGYGFVRLDSAAAGSSASRADNQDVFIPPNALRGAMHGDMVLVEEEPPARDGRRSGRIARVLTRRHPTVVGIFHYGRPAGRRYGSGRSAGIEAFASAELQGNYVQPFEERLGGPIEIPEGADTVAAAGRNAHRTLGEEAERAAGQAKPHGGPEDHENRWPLEGLAVEVEITSYPQPGRPAQGRVVEVLGPPDAFGVDVEIVIRKHAIPHTFPVHVLAEAEERAREVVTSLPAEELSRREDFRGLPIVTIDGETARDFDDAVLVRPLANGNTELQVHIADVGWYVRSGSALDTEARVRGTSVYFPDRAVPMLPHALSSGMCSLLPHEDRLVQSCVMEIDDRGEILGYRVTEGMIRSARRMTYTSVQRCLNASPRADGWNGGRGGVQAEVVQEGIAGPGGTQIPSRSAPLGGNDSQKSRGKDNSKGVVTPEALAQDRLERERVGLEQPELPDAMDRMLELALRLNRKRARRGSIDFDLPEPVVEFDPDGNMKAIVRSERGWAHRLIEEFMLSANECVATWLTAQGVSSIYRIHEMPDPKRIVEFEETAAGFGQTLGIAALPVKRLTMKTDRREAQRRSAKGQGGRGAPQHELPERIPVTPQMYQRLVRRIAGEPEERILAYLMLRSLKQARYAEKNEGHFALASPCYTHFTSPIRRYPDLIVHRLLRTMLRRGADGRGGALLSTDPQPWMAELARSQGRHAVQGTLDAAVPKTSVQVRKASAPVALERPERRSRAKRAGRVGWSEEGSGGWSASAAEGAAAEGLAEHRFLTGMTDRKIDPDISATDPLVANAADVAGLAEDGTSLAAFQGDPISATELTDIAVESSQAERRAADAERELIEWKKMKFMADRVGDDFQAIILSVTKYGFFVELDEMFIEGLVPIGSLVGDFYTFRDADRVICGERTGHCFRIGERVEVILDRIDRQQRRLQFALLPGTEPTVVAGAGSLRAGKSEGKKARAEANRKVKAAAKPKGRKRSKRS